MATSQSAWDKLLQQILGGVGTALGNGLGGLGGTIGNGMANWLGGLFGGNGVANYPGSQWDSKAVDLYTDLFGRAKGLENPNFTTTNLTPAEVNYFSNLVNANVTSPDMSVGNLQQNLIGQLENWDPSMLGDPSKVLDNDTLKAILSGNLDTLNKRSKEGFDETDRMMNSEILQEAAKQSSRMGDAITQNAQERGIAGGGQEFAQRMAAAQGAAEQGQSAGLQLANEARNRKDSALSQANALGTQMRGQDVDISRANADFTNQFLQSNVAAQNAAKQWNAATNNDRTVQNTNIGNAQNQNQWAAQNDANKFNTANKFDASKFNAQNQNDTNRWNAETSNAQNLQNTNTKNQFAVDNRTNAFDVAKANYEGKANNFDNVLKSGAALGQQYGNMAATQSNQAMAMAANANAQNQTGGAGGSGNVFGDILGSIWDIFFEDGGQTPEGQPYVVGEKGPEWGVNTPDGTMIAPMRTGDFVTDFMAMQQDPAAQQNTQQSRSMNRDKNYYFPPKYDFTKRLK